MSTPLERAEEPIHELTQKAIEDILDKYPRKKTVFKEFCYQYEILDIDEMSEPEALEILDIMDNRTYIQIIRAKKQFLIEKAHQDMVDCVDHYLKAHGDEFIVLAAVTDCWLVAKKVKLLVNTKNDNSPFQPYEKQETKDYFIVVAIKTADEFIPDELINRFITKGCKMVRIYDDLEAYRKLGEIK